MLRVDDLTQVFPNAAEDIRGFSVRTPQGEDVGTVTAVFLDVHQNKVRFLEVGAAQEGRSLLVPVDAITDVRDVRINIEQSAERVWTAPQLTPADTHSEVYWESLYHHYGYLPHWFADNIFPGYPSP